MRSGSKLKPLSPSPQITRLPSHYSQLNQTCFLKIRQKFMYHPSEDVQVSLQPRIFHLSSPAWPPCRLLTTKYSKQLSEKPHVSYESLCLLISATGNAYSIHESFTLCSQADSARGCKSKSSLSPGKWTRTSAQGVLGT